MNVVFKTEWKVVALKWPDKDWADAKDWADHLNALSADDWSVESIMPERDGAIVFCFRCTMENA